MVDVTRVDFDVAIGQLAERQEGMVDRRQLRGARHWQRGHRQPGEAPASRPVPLGRTHSGPPPVSKGRWMAAVLAAGPGAVLSHRRPPNSGGYNRGQTLPIEITSELRRRPRPGLTPHRSRLPLDETTVRNGVATTTVPRTILDLAAGSIARQIERLINEADVPRLWTASPSMTSSSGPPAEPDPQPYARLCHAGAPGRRDQEPARGDAHRAAGRTRPAAARDQHGRTERRPATTARPVLMAGSVSGRVSLERPGQDQAWRFRGTHSTSGGWRRSSSGGPTVSGTGPSMPVTRRPPSAVPKWRPG